MFGPHSSSAYRTSPPDRARRRFARDALCPHSWLAHRLFSLSPTLSTQLIDAQVEIHARGWEKDKRSCPGQISS
jgi:hypothetical protein